MKGINSIAMASNWQENLFCSVDLWASLLGVIIKHEGKDKIRSLLVPRWGVEKESCIGLAARPGNCIISCMRFSFLAAFNVV